MRLTHVTIERFQNFMDAQEVTIEPDVTCLVGKNESGKTTILRALHRLNPANGTSRTFNLTTEYPRARLSRDRRRDPELESFCPVTARFHVDEVERAQLIQRGLRIPRTSSLVLIASRSYGNTLRFQFEAAASQLIEEAADAADVHEDDLARLSEEAPGSDIADRCRDLAAELTTDGQAARAKAVAAVPTELAKLRADLGAVTDEEKYAAVHTLLPQFFYFSDYGSLPGQVNLHSLAERVEAGTLTASDDTVVALLDYAGQTPKDLLDEEYISRRSELQAAGRELTDKVFEYWKQNTDLAVVLNDDMPIVARDAQNREVRHRVLHIELRDDRHGGVETNFATRSSGFQWFFSFLAAFSKYQDSDEAVIVLLDEPGTSLHGEAQAEFLRYITAELATKQQVLYTTHSQHMIDPSRYETLRAVHDRASRDNHNAGVSVTPVSLSADRDTVLPIEAALGYSISQHLFIGSGHHLIVEGSSDFIYLQRVSEHLVAKGREGLDPRLAILAVGSVENVAPFVALLGRRLTMSVLIDGPQSSRQLQRIKAAAAANNVADTSLVLCADVDADLPNSADIEDLFATDDYLWLHNQTFPSNAVSTEQLPPTREPILKRLQAVRGADFDHALPAHTLTQVREAFFAQARAETLDRFAALIGKLNATLPDVR